MNSYENQSTHIRGKIHIQASIIIIENTIDTNTVLIWKKNIQGTDDAFF
jgi:hypothetical protein